MEITTIAAAAAALFFSEAVKTGGKAFGEEASKAVSQLIAAVRNKFSKAGTAGLLTRSENNPTEANVNLVEAELVVHLHEDQEFADLLQSLIEKLKSVEAVRQIMLSDIETTEGIKAEGLSQQASRNGAVEQEMLTNVKAKAIEVKNLTQSS